MFAVAGIRFVDAKATVRDARPGFAFHDAPSNETVMIASDKLRHLARQFFAGVDVQIVQAGDFLNRSNQSPAQLSSEQESRIVSGDGGGSTGEYQPE